MAWVLAFAFALAGCEPTVSTLMLPMEPTSDSIAAPRRELTDAEKDQISDAVARKLLPATHRDFRWAPLVVGSRGHPTDYCGLASGSDVDERYNGFSKYLAELTFDRGGKLVKVDVRKIAKSKIDALPTEVDSTCVQDGYGGLPVVR